MLRKFAMLLVLVACAGFCDLTPRALGQQHPETVQQVATLVARRTVDGYDNYDLAAFSFKYGGNGPITKGVTRNNWDLLFGNSPDRDTFDVTMVTDDRSRIRDLGVHNWEDTFTIPNLDAWRTPTREKSVAAIVGHMYLVHSSDTDSNHYALFRVESLDSLKSVTISWKLIPEPSGLEN